MAEDGTRSMQAGKKRTANLELLIGPEGVREIGSAWVASRRAVLARILTELEDYGSSSFCVVRVFVYFFLFSFSRWGSRLVNLPRKYQSQLRKAHCRPTQGLL